MPEIRLYVYVKNLTDPTALPSRLRNQMSFRYSENIHPARTTTIIGPPDSSGIIPDDSPLKSVSRATDGNSLVTERCIFLMRGKPDRKVIGAVVIKGLLVMRPKEKKVFSLELCMGEAKVEFFGKLIEDLCELLAAYRELPFIRDIGILKKKEVKKVGLESILAKPEESKGNQLDEEDPETKKDESAPEKRHLKQLELSKIAKSIDQFFANNTTKLVIGLGEVSIALFENTVAANKVVVSAEPFIKVSFPAGSMTFAQEDERVTANVFGAVLECTKKISFLSHFVKVRRSHVRNFGPSSSRFPATKPFKSMYSTTTNCWAAWRRSASSSSTATRPSKCSTPTPATDSKTPAANLASMMG